MMGVMKVLESIYVSQIKYKMVTKVLMTPPGQ